MNRRKIIDAIFNILIVTIVLSILFSISILIGSYIKTGSKIEPQKFQPFVTFEYDGCEYIIQLKDGIPQNQNFLHKPNCKYCLERYYKNKAEVE